MGLTLLLLFIITTTFVASIFGSGEARRGSIPPKWGCDRGATKPEPKSDATLRAAVLFGPDLVARSLQTAEGYARVSVRKHLAPRLGQKSFAANVVVFMKWGTMAG